MKKIKIFEGQNHFKVYSLHLALQQSRRSPLFISIQFFQVYGDT